MRDATDVPELQQHAAARRMHDAGNLELSEPTPKDDGAHDEERQSKCLNVELPPVLEKLHDLEGDTMSRRVYHQHFAEHRDADLKADARQESDQIRA